MTLRDDHLRPLSPSSALEPSSTGHVSKLMLKSVQKIFRRPGPKRPQDLFRTRKPTVEDLPISSHIHAQVPDRHSLDAPPLASRPLPQVPTSLLTQAEGSQSHSSQHQASVNFNVVPADQKQNSFANKIKAALFKLKPTLNRKKEADQQDDQAWTATGDLPSHFFLDDFEVVDRPSDRHLREQVRPQTADRTAQHRRQESFWFEVVNAMQPSQPVNPSVEHGKGTTNGSSLFVSKNLRGELGRSDGVAVVASSKDDANVAQVKLDDGEATKKKEMRATLSAQASNLDAKELRKRLEGVQARQSMSVVPSHRQSYAPILRPIASNRNSLAAKMLDVDGPPTKVANIPGDNDETTKREVGHAVKEEILQDVTQQRQKTVESGNLDEDLQRLMSGRHLWRPISLPYSLTDIFGANLPMASPRTAVMPQLGHSRQAANLFRDNDVLKASEQKRKAPSTLSSCSYSTEEEDAATMDSRLMDVFSRIQEWRASVAATPVQKVFAPSASNSHLEEILQLSPSSDLTSVSRRVEVGQHVGQGLQGYQTEQEHVLTQQSHFSSMDGTGDSLSRRSEGDDVQYVRSSSRQRVVQDGWQKKSVEAIASPLTKSAQVDFGPSTTQALPARISFHGSPDDLIKLFKGSISFAALEDKQGTDMPPKRRSDLLTDAVSDRANLQSPLPFGTAHIRQLSPRDSEALMEFFERKMSSECQSTAAKDGGEVCNHVVEQAEAPDSKRALRPFLEEALDTLGNHIDRMSDFRDMHRAFIQLQHDLLKHAPDDAAHQSAITDRLAAIEKALFVPA